MRLLDLFCGAGGAGEGYRRAGFDVTGVDLSAMPENPHTFIQADALDYLREHGHEYDAIHASPPCQAHSITRNIWKDNVAWQEAHTDMIGATRDLLEASGKPYVIENVPGAPLRNPITLCGNSFGLRVYRHRLFEANWMLMAAPHVKHVHRASYGRIPVGEEFYTISGHYGDFAGASAAMGIDWMTHKQLAQAIPPAYTEHIGLQLRELLVNLQDEHKDMLPDGMRP
jgi:DNA (cytosine-5)-methyltransferase 1